MICACERRALEAEAARVERRAAMERSLDEQYASACAHWDAQGKPRLTRSEWLAGGYEDEEPVEVPNHRRFGAALALVITAVAAALLTR